MVTIGDLENNEIESIHIEGITNIPLIKGEQGEKGDKGDKGETNNIKIGTVETGEKASATLEGESPNQILNLVLPKGDKGEQGEPGIKPVKGIDYFTEEEIQEIKSNILDQVNQFSVLVVEELPNDNIDEHTIYFVPKTKTEQNDVYDEFIYINNGWEHIGTTEVDLSSYYKKDEIDTKLEAVEGNEVFVGNEKEAPSSAKIIVEEDDFVEGSTLGKAEVYVGAEEPITGEKVWFRKGKNVFNAYSSDISYYLRNTDKEKYIINNSNSITVEGNGITWNRVGITISNLKANTEYTINSIVTNTTQGYAGLLCDYGNNSVQYVSNKEKFNAKITIVTDENGKVKLQFYTNYSSTTQNSSAIFSEIQLEEGEKATTYEAYIEPQIFVRNSNGVYEEFTKKSEEVYSTEEVKIGTWIDGKPLYRKVLSLTTPSTTNSTKIANFDKTFIIKNYYGNAFISASNQLLPINFYFTDVYKIATYVVNNSGEIYMKIGSEAYRNQQATLTIEYTKTTD